jgi:excisionase family DNA binding protein
MTAKTSFTTGDVARYCGVNFRTVSRWVKRGELKAHELPGRGDKRIEVQDLLAFLQKNHFPLPEGLAAYAKRALIVDDDPLMAQAIQRVLKKVGFSTQIARDGFEAGALMGTFMPALMILDLRMPGLNGFQVLQNIRESERFHNIKVLVVSALTHDALDRALACGADDVLEKPFSNEELLERVVRLTGIHPVKVPTFEPVS